jgi:hypothetical protein
MKSKCRLITASTPVLGYPFADWSVAGRQRRFLCLRQKNRGRRVAQRNVT